MGRKSRTLPTGAKTDPRLVSIIVNNYNYARFLPEAIESALGQFHPAVEVIVVDDGSTDDSVKVIRSYAKRVKPVLKANGGQASAFNSGFRESRGDVVIFLDADDVLMETAAERALAAIDSPGVAKVHWPLKEINVDGRPTGRLQPVWPLPDGDVSEKMIKAGPGLTTPPTSGNAWARWFLQAVLPMPHAEYRISADFYLAQLAMVAGELRTIDEPQALIRLHGSSNYGALPLDQKIAHDLRRYEDMCARMHLYLQFKGIQTSIADWKAKSGWYARLNRLSACLARLKEIVPAGHPFVLADDDDWRTGGVQEVMADRRALQIALPGSGSETNPDADATALRQVARLRSKGATTLVVAGPPRHRVYSLEKFLGQLSASYPCVLKDADMIVFDLRYKARPGVLPPGKPSEFRAEVGSTATRRAGAATTLRASLEVIAREATSMVERLDEVTRELNYMRFTAAVADIVRSTVPAGERVAIVSKGDDRLVQWSGQDVVHFPQGKGGEYLGFHPADSAAAIKNLEAARRRGVAYLVIPNTASWWLTHYQDFAEHLDERYGQVWANETCRIYQLKEPSAKAASAPDRRRRRTASAAAPAIDRQRRRRAAPTPMPASSQGRRWAAAS